MFDTINSIILGVQITSWAIVNGYSPDIQSVAAAQHVNLHHGSSLLLFAVILRTAGPHEHILHSAILGQSFSVLLTEPTTFRLKKDPALFQALLGPPTCERRPPRGQNKSISNTLARLEDAPDSTHPSGSALLSLCGDTCGTRHEPLTRHIVHCVSSSLARDHHALFEFPVRVHGPTKPVSPGRASTRSGSKTICGPQSTSKSHGQIKSGPPKGKAPSKQDNGVDVAVHEFSGQKMSTRLGCFVSKSGQCQPACNQPKHCWKLTRSLCRSAHLKGHVTRGHITQEQLDELEASVNRMARGILSEEEKWRTLFVYLYPEHDRNWSRLNPYAGLPLLDGEDPNDMWSSGFLRQTNALLGQDSTPDVQTRSSRTPSGPGSMTTGTTAVTTVWEGTAPVLQLPQPAALPSSRNEELAGIQGATSTDTDIDAVPHDLIVDDQAQQDEQLLVVGGPQDANKTKCPDCGFAPVEMGIHCPCCLFTNVTNDNDHET